MIQTQKELNNEKEKYNKLLNENEIKSKNEENELKIKEDKMKLEIEKQNQDLLKNDELIKNKEIEIKSQYKLNTRLSQLFKIKIITRYYFTS